MLFSWLVTSTPTGTWVRPPSSRNLPNAASGWPAVGSASGTCAKLVKGTFGSAV